MGVERIDEYMDNEIRPQDDFFRYVNGKWLKNTQIPPDKTRYGSFTILHDKSMEDVRSIVEQEHEGEYKSISIFYKAGMDIERRNKLDYDPIKPLLKTIDAIQTRKDLNDAIVQLENKMVLGLINFSSNMDRKNTSIEIPHFSSGGLSLPNPRFGNRDYYLEEDKKQIREKYVEHLIRLFEFVGEENAPEKAKSVLDFETNLAEKHYTQVQKRDPELSYNKMEFSDFVAKYPTFNWNGFVRNYTTLDLNEINIDNPTFFELFDDLLQNASIDTWKTYLKGRLLLLTASTLSERFENAHFEFYGKILQGQKEMQSLWKRIIDWMNNRFVLGELVGKLYVERFFPPSSKEKMNELVNNLIIALENRIKSLEWMSEITKAKALEKLKAFNVKIGYPDVWEDYSGLQLSEDMSFSEILRTTVKYNRDLMLKNLYKAPDKNKWFMSPQTVNAYYSPLHNEIVFPAAILQFPFFDPEMSDAENYGGIGTVIGHEITHGYDDKGSMFGPDGNMENWWTEEDRKAFNERAQHFIEEYEKFKVNGKPLIGKLTLGENIGDIGGIRIAFAAMKEHFRKHGEPPADKFTNEEKFFMSYARIWRALSRPEIQEVLRTSDPHSPPEARVNVALANIPEFHEVFKTKPGDGMYREKIVTLW